MDIKSLLSGQLDLAQMNATQPAGLDRAQGQGQKSADAMHKAGQEFEAYFISHLIGKMRETIPKGLLDRKGEQVWYSFYDQEIAKLATQAGGIGLAAFVDAYVEKNR